MTWLLSSLAAGTAVGLPEEYGEGDSTREESNRKCDDGNGDDGDGDGDGDDGDGGDGDGEVEGKGNSVAENDDCIVEESRENDIVGCSEVDADTSDVVLGFSPEGEVALMS